MRKQEKLTCFDCIHARIDSGTWGSYYTPPEPAMAECQNKEVDVNLLEEHEWNETIMPSLCGHFQPRLVGKCSNCGKEINTPEWSWTLWAYTIGDAMPVCSEECKRVIEDEVDEDENAERF